MSSPERTCLACRQSTAREELVRLVVHPETNAVVVDYRGRLPGRGAWVHPVAACVTRLEKKPAVLNRALGSAEDLDRLGQNLLVAIRRSCLDGLSLAAASGSLIGGHDKLLTALSNNEVVWVITAQDASERTLLSLRKGASKRVAFQRIDLDSEALGVRVGSSPRAAIGVRRSSATSYLLKQLHRLRDMG